LRRQFTELSQLHAQNVDMQELFDLIRASPWPFIGGAIVVVGAIAAEVLGNGSSTADLPDVPSDD
jgi:hypothetical protein